MRPVFIAVAILLAGMGFDVFWNPSRTATAGCNNNCRVRFFFKYCVGGGSTSGACARFDEPVCHLCVNGQCTDVDWAKVEPCNPYYNTTMYIGDEVDCVHLCPCGAGGTGPREADTFTTGSSYSTGRTACVWFPQYGDPPTP